MSEESSIPRGVGGTLPHRSEVPGSPEYRRWEQERELTIEFFRLLVESTNTFELLDSAIKFFRQHSGCEAVGVRLRDGNEIPFFDAHGFSEEFLLDANSLCVTNGLGEMNSYADGNLSFQCRCGDVVCGRVDPSLPFFTQHGSFWSNGIPEHSSPNSLQEWQPPRCSASGYHSVALIPLKTSGTRFGLIQFNDKRNAMFSARDIALWESLADHLAVALAKFRTEEALLSREAQLRSIFENLNEGLMVAAPNGLILQWNQAAVEMHGLPNSPNEGLFRELANTFELSTINGKVLSVDEWPMARVLQGERLHDEEFQVRRLDRDDWTRVFSYGGTPICDADGRTVIAVVTIGDVTDRKRAEDALLLSEERSQGLLETISDALVVHEFNSVGVPGHFLEVNDVMCKRLGYTRKELLSMSPADLDDPASGISAVNIGLQLRDKSDVIFDQVHVAKDGTRIPVRIHSRLFTRHGRPAVISLVRDTSERKLSEQALRESEQRLIQAVNVARLGIFEYEHSTGLIDCSNTFRSIYGFSEEQTVTLDAILERISPEDREWLLPALRQSVDSKGDGLFRQEHRIMHPEGVRWLIVRGQTFFEDSAKARRPVRTVGAIVDITERKQAELELLASQRQLRTALDAAKLGIWSRDLESGDYDCDDFTRSIFNWPKGANVTVEILLDRIVEEDRERFREMRDSMIAGQRGSDAGFEFRIRQPDGTIRWVSVWGSRSRDRSGKPIRLTGVAQDITQRKQTEQEMKTLEQQFLHAQRMEAVGRLAGGVAHDFNNLLMVIRSYTEIMEDSLPPDDALRRNTQAVMQAADRAASLTKQMLAFSRKQVLSPVALNLNTAVTESAKMLQRLIGEDIELRVIPTEEIGTVRADPDQISQVLMNLSVNARDAMPKGGKLTIETHNVTVDEVLIASHPYVLPGNYVTCSVTDTGTGISKEVQERMFEPFFTTKNVGKGTGLGLSTVYGIVKQSGGYLLVDSELGRGTCFTFYLPRTSDSAAEVPKPPKY